MNCEKNISVKLSKLGFENYVVIQIEEHQWSNRKKKMIEFTDDGVCSSLAK